MEHKLSNVRNEPMTQSVKNKKKERPLESFPRMEDWERYIGRIDMVKARAGEECPEHFGWECYCVGFLSRGERRLADVKPLISKRWKVKRVSIISCCIMHNDLLFLGRIKKQIIFRLHL